MLENRSLDNVLGWLYSDQQNQPAINIPPPAEGKKPTYDGLEDGKYFQPLTYSGKVAQYPIIKGTCGNGFAVPSLDPWEEYEHVTNQLFGDQLDYKQPTPVRGTPPTMKGFLQDFTTSYLAIAGFSDEIRKALVDHGGKLGEEVWQALQELPPDLKNLSLQTWYQSLQILQTFTPEQLPVLNGLARAFAVSDRWFSSVPTQTNPNRAFFHCGTSLGREKNNNLHADEHFPTDTLWNILDHYSKDSAHECECSWRIFYQEDFPPDKGKCYTGYTFPNIYNIPNAEEHFLNFSKFKALAENGELPDFSFLEPRWGWGVNKDYPGDWKLPYQQGNDYHPPTSVRAGELFVKGIYDSLKKNTEAWEQTLFIITFDEHGGTWDHVAPPWHATPPDSNVGEHGFKFDRFGVRVPTLLISPYIEPQTVFGSETSVPYDHTSIIATILKWKGIDPKAPKPNSDSNDPWLGQRVVNAPTIEGVLTRTTPRSDKPLVDDPPPERNSPITIKNDTPAQIYVYLGWGPDTGPTKDHKLPTTIWGNVPTSLTSEIFPGSPDPGKSVTYDTIAKLGGKLFDYWIQASYYVGPNSGTPRDLVDSVLHLNNDWRLFWKGWRLISHHDSLAISLGKPHATIKGPDTKGQIQITNKGVYPIKFDIRYDLTGRGDRTWSKWGTLPPGKSMTLSTNDWLNYKYYLQLKYWSKGFLPHITETWVDFWPDWKPVGRNATVTIMQDQPKISSPCGE